MEETHDQLSESLDLREQQLRIEHEIAEAGVRRYWDRIQRVTDIGLETISPPVQHAMRSFVEPLAEELEQRYAEAHRKPGRKSAFVKLLYWADMSVVSLLTLRTVLDSVSRPQRFTTIAMRIGREIEQELRFQQFEADAPGLYTTVQRGIDENPRSYRRDYRKRVLVHAANKYDVFWEPWTETQLYGVGVWLLDAVVEATGLVGTRLIKTQRGTMSNLRVVPAPSLLEWMDEQHTACEGLTPRRAPMVCPPDPWETPSRGGYLTHRMREPLVWATGANRSEVEDMYRREAMPVVYDAVNAAQGTPLRVDDVVYLTASSLWDNGAALPDIDRDDVPLPPKPEKGAPEVEWAEYKLRAREVSEHNEGMRGRRMASSLTLAMAKKYRNRTIWAPHKLDFRGRMYTQPNFLDHQGADLGKGLIQLAESEPLTERGLWWISVHAANCWGVDKVSLEQRVAWVEENIDFIRDIVRDPVGERAWEEADSPFQFLSACGAVCAGVEGKPVGVPAMVDGSCNGIQHLAAMSLDSDAGALVNLVPGPEPGDIYSVVANKLREKVEEQRDTPTSRSTASGKELWNSSQSRFIAECWLKFGITRKMAKRPTMILPYNGTHVATERYIGDHLSSEIRGTGEDPFGNHRDLAVKWITELIRPTMREVVSGPVRIMNWTRELAKPITASQKPLIWTSPSGFTVRQRYREMASRRIRTRVGDRIYHLSLSESTDKLDHRKQAQSLAPNWIHSYDAAALHMTLAQAREEGIAMIAVHDSYGAHPNHLDRLNEILRDKFVDCYQGRGAMEQLRVDLSHNSGVPMSELPPPPERGDLDLDAVRESEFFFA